MARRSTAQSRTDIQRKFTVRRECGTPTLHGNGGPSLCQRVPCRAIYGVPDGPAARFGYAL